MFDRLGLPHAVWGHISDGNVHPNALPRTLEEAQAGQAAILRLGRIVTAMGGSPLAEHGVGHADHRRLANARQRVDRVLDLAGTHLSPPHLMISSRRAT